MNFFYFLFFLLVSNWIQSFLTMPTCVNNEIEVNCAVLTECEPSCKNLQGLKCERSCAIEKECQCNVGFVRDFDGNCIEPSQCPQVSPKLIHSCGPNEIQIDCASQINCQTTCHSSLSINCSDHCEQNGCICQDGFIRFSSENNTCVPQIECPIENRIETNETCSENELWTECKDSCGDTKCNNEASPHCFDNCKPGCSCMKGFERSSTETGSKCVPCQQSLPTMN